MRNTQWVLLMLALIPYQTTWGQQARLPVIQVEMDGRTALANGLAIGRQSKSLFPNIEKRYDQFLSSLINQRQMERLLTQHLPALLNGLSPSHQEEIQGVEASWALTADSVLGDGQLSKDEYRLINFLPDLGFMPNGSGFAAFDKMSATNTPIIGRNLDWKTSSSLQNLQSITVYKNDESTTVMIGFAGLVSSMTGYNDHGLFLTSLNAAPYSPYTNPGTAKAPTSTAFEIKTLLNSKRTLKQAKKYLSTKAFSVDLNILMADKKSVEVLEYSKTGKAKFRTWKSPLHANTPWDKRHQLAVVNCFALLKMPNHCHSEGNVVRWKRLNELATFSQHAPAGINEISGIMSDTKNERHEILNRYTLHSIVFQPNSGKLYLYANLNGEHDESPTYQAYFSITEKLIRNETPSTSLLNFKTLSWFFITLLGLLLWLIMRRRP